jgi:AraC family ethanolamine operon transcriptional activator
MTMITTYRPERTTERIVSACIELARRRRYCDLTMTDLCEASGMSERRIRQAFADCLGTSPMLYLRRVALQAVRHALYENPFERDAVTRAASDFGFTHLSRFAGHYRALFDETPSTTLARARQSALVAV